MKNELDMRRTIKLKHRVLNAVFTRRIVLARVLDGLKLFAAVSRIPLLGRLHPLTKPSNNYFTNLPMNVDIQADSVPLPPAIATELIKRAKYHHILDKCLCRHGRDCKKHNHDIGCLFLGASGLDVVPQFSRRVTAEEALAHVERGLADGLMPMIGRFRVDNYAFLLPDHHTLLGVCFCCDCCCFMNYYRPTPQELLEPIYPLLEGLEIKVTERCQACGRCTGTCRMRAITVKNGRAHHSERCRGCGRCASTCINNAVDIRITDSNYFEKTLEKFLTIAKI
ncbi:DUF362 domain-containing protein [Oryzomonas rubra]|uniref:4Fe-4S ferredoxin-type domain-containing protein n=1 Tax=Oryzomonas rubra TaxID=2509454 RepID=A0A5A9X7E6_9BACT|nr:hypothetical protein [Oryzomonas rubra]KAA0888378.1 hypothetical protein ET418_16750 [Oryzomonas rubra]